MNNLLDFCRNINHDYKKNAFGKEELVGIPMKEKVVGVLKEIESDIRSIIAKAWKDWLESTEAGRSRFGRTRAAIVWEGIIRHAYEVLSEKGVTIKEKHQTVNFHISGVWFRFKQADKKGMSKNIPTRTALAYHDHARQMPLFEENSVRVEVVYILNKLKTAIENIRIVARDKTNIIWQHDISPAGAIVEQLPLPATTKTSPKEIVDFGEISEKKKESNRE